MKKLLIIFRAFNMHFTIYLLFVLMSDVNVFFCCTLLPQCIQLWCVFALYLKRHRDIFVIYYLCAFYWYFVMLISHICLCFIWIHDVLLVYISRWWLCMCSCHFCALKLTFLSMWINSFTYFVFYNLSQSAFYRCCSYFFLHLS